MSCTSACRKLGGCCDWDDRSLCVDLWTAFLGRDEGRDSFTNHLLLLCTADLIEYLKACALAVSAPTIL